jgi:hypothetical protein
MTRRNLVGTERMVALEIQLMLHDHIITETQEMDGHYTVAEIAEEVLYRLYDELEAAKRWKNRQEEKSE